jgi:putative sterol carrier protein
MSPDVQRIAATMGEGFAGAPPLGGTLVLDFGADGCIVVAGKTAPVRVSFSENASGMAISVQKGGADCVVGVALDTFKRMLAGEVDAAAIYMQGKLRIAGDVGLALKLGPALRAGREARGGDTAR